MTSERWCLLAMALGLVMIGQPLSQAIFVLGFPVTFLGIVAFNIISRKEM